MSKMLRIRKNYGVYEDTCQHQVHFSSVITRAVVEAKSFETRPRPQNF